MSETNEEFYGKLVSTSPVVAHKSYDKYVDALHNKIAADDVYNIGVIAPYGAGKSSLIMTYKDKYPKEKTITISLANFNASDKDNNSEGVGEANVKDIECAVEKSILQQFLFHVKKSRVPNSRIQGINYNQRIFSFGFGFLLIAFIVLLSCTILEFLNKLPNSDGSNFYWYAGFCVLTAIIFVFWTIYHFRLEKIKVKDIEASFCDIDKQSILNTFIDEILYFFHTTKTSIVIIEDLERFNNFNLFSKLREINFLINNSEIVKQKVTFIYAVNDSLFKTEADRSKFFDFILSLTPVLSVSNARDELKKNIESNCNDLQLPDAFINEITQFIQDKRVLNNIINDYIIYYNLLKINKTQENLIKLFSLIVYKNLRPSDFAELQFGRGQLAEFFKEKSRRVAQKIKECDDEITKLTSEKAQAAKLWINNFDCLKYLIKGLVISRGGQYNYNYINIDNIKTFESMADDKYLTNNSRGLTKQEVEIILGESLESLEKKINSLKKDDIKKTNNTIADKQKQKRKFVNISLQKLLVEDKDFLGTINDELIRFLFVNGYISEDYLDYILQVGNSVISSSDRAFIRRVLAKDEIEFSLKLDKPDVVIQEIEPNRFEDRYVLNYDLVNYLFNPDIKGDKKRKLLSYLSSGDEYSDKFIISYIIDSVAGTNSIELLLNNLAKRYNELTAKVLFAEDMSDDIKEKYIITLLNVCATNTIERHNYNNALSDYLADKNNVIDKIAKFVPEKFTEITLKLDCKLKQLRCSEQVYSIATILALNSNFEINKENLSFILFDLSGLEQEKYKYALFSAILSSEMEEVIAYCKQNINIVLKIILSMDSCEEHQDAIEYILKDEKLSIEAKEQFIDKLNAKYLLVAGLPKEIVEYSIEKLSPEWGNFRKLMGEYSVSKELQEKYLRLNYTILSQEKLTDKDLVLYLCNQISYDNEEKLKVIDELSKSFVVTILASEVARDNVSAILVKNNIIEANESNFNVCRFKSKTLSQMIVQNNELIKNIQVNTVPSNVINEVLIYCADGELVAKILQQLGDQFVPVSSSLPEVVKLLISCDHAVYPKTVFKAIINAITINIDDKLKIISNYNGEISKSELINIVLPLDPNIQDLITKDEIRINITDVSPLICCLKNKGIISVTKYIKVAKIRKIF